jgi:hypothetical protein
VAPERRLPTLSALRTPGPAFDLDHPPKSVVEVQTMIQTAREHTKKWQSHTRNRRVAALRWFARAGHLDRADARDMAGWVHGAVFSVDASVRVEGADGKGEPESRAMPLY